MTKKKQYRSLQDNDDFHDDTMMDLGTQAVNKIPWAHSLIILFLCVLIFSDVFQQAVLSHIKEAMDENSPTTKGTFIQIGVLLLGFNFAHLTKLGGSLS
jgi:hypothetical protein